MIRFPPGKSFVEIPLRRAHNVPVIPVGVNGSRPLKLILDTGSEVPVLFGGPPAGSLNLKTAEEGIARGGSGPATPVSIAGEVTFSISRLRLTGQRLCFLRRVGGDALSPRARNTPDGVIGRPVFDNLTTEFDRERRLIRFYDPAKFTYSGRGTILPLSFDERGIPHITAEVKVSFRGRPVAARLMVDTGADNALSLVTGSRQGIALPEKILGTGMGGGINGATAFKLGRVKSIKIGRYLFRDVLTSFVEPVTRSTIRRGGRQGLIGEEILRRFSLIFDYSRGRMILEPNGAFKDPFQ